MSQAETVVSTAPLAPTRRRLAEGFVVGAWQAGPCEARGALCDLFAAWPRGRQGTGRAPYLLKLPRTECQSDPRALALLEREAEVGRQVTHPHLISVLDAGIQGADRFVVLPYLEGATLAEILAEGQPLPLMLVLWLARQAAQALQALHAANWLHMDLKPANLHVSPRGHLTLLDLGFARRTTAERSVDDAILGTPAYLAPEALAPALPIDARSDLYSLGVVLFELLTHRRPFEGDSVAEVLERHRRAPPPDPRAIAPAAPRALAELVRSLLAKEPLRRPQSAAELADQLVRLEIAAFAESWCE
ncbi:MAG: serine/threonine-protein kinase [Pirellulales bacterium]